MASFIGRPIPRREDLRLVRGQGRYTDDINLPEQAYAAFLRSPYAHAKLRKIDVSAARAAPGVLAVLTGADYAADGLMPIRHGANGADAVDPTRPTYAPPACSVFFDIPQPVLAVDRVRLVGEAVAIVVASTLAEARDAVELIEVDYEPLPAVTTAIDAIAAGAPLVWDNVAGNQCLKAEFGDIDGTTQALAGAPHVVRFEFMNNRVANCQMEPRSAIAQYDAATGLHTMIAGSQGVGRQRDTLRALLGGLPADKVHVICPDVGGGFGPRTFVYPEQAAIAWAARRTGRPVKWTSDRSEGFLTDFQGRDLVTRAALAFDRDGKILAFRSELFGNIGAFTIAYASLSNGYRIAPTVYEIPRAHVSINGVLTNTVPTAPYRGAGRPEAMHVMERLFDLAARKIGIDRIELRRRNLIRRTSLPYRTAMGLTIDSGDFHGNMDAALRLSDWAGFTARRDAARKRGRLAGIGLGNYVEAPVGAPKEKVILRVRADDKLELITGTQSTGQGHETVYAQVAAEKLGIPMDSVAVMYGDSKVFGEGGGSHSNRSMRLVGTLIVESSASLIEKGKELAAHLLGASAASVTFDEGLYRAPASNQSLSLFDLAHAQQQRKDLPEALKAPLTAAADIAKRIPAFPTGCAVCELEVDPDTGAVEITRYSAVDDVGKPINPLIVHGQVHGGIAMGVGQALLEDAFVDRKSGQVVSGSFMDYGLPRADMLPSYRIEEANDLTAGNPLAVKGGGEGGLTPALGAVINAIVDALKEYDVEHVDMPATPQRVWAAIQDARRKGEKS